MERLRELDRDFSTETAGEGMETSEPSYRGFLGKLTSRALLGLGLLAGGCGGLDALGKLTDDRIVNVYTVPPGAKVQYFSPNTDKWTYAGETPEEGPLAIPIRPINIGADMAVQVSKDGYFPQKRITPKFYEDQGLFPDKIPWEIVDMHFTLVQDRLYDFILQVNPGNAEVALQVPRATTDPSTGQQVFTGQFAFRKLDDPTPGDGLIEVSGLRDFDLDGFFTFRGTAPGYETLVDDLEFGKDSYTITLQKLQ